MKIKKIITVMAMLPIVVSGVGCGSKSKDSSEGSMSEVKKVSINFVDENNGWIAAPRRMGTTTDGGKTWGKISLPDDLEGRTLYLSNDAKYLSVMTIDNKTITVLEKNYNKGRI